MSLDILRGKILKVLNSVHLKHKEWRKKCLVVPSPLLIYK